MKQLYIICTLAFLAVSTLLNAQGGARKHVSEKHERYYDSLKNTPYDRALPIWGDKVYKKGFDLPFPFGIMINNYVVKQDIEISNIHIGIRQPDSTFGPVDLSKVIEFNKVEATVYNINARVDAWIFPFLNIYGLLAYVPYASTRVELSKPVQITSEPEQTGWAYGFGIMGAGGIGPVWIQADYNVTWADMELLQNKVRTQISGIRVGHVFPGRHDPEKNVSFWIGMMGIFLNNETVGEIALSDVFSGLSQEKIDEIKASYGDWYNTLTPPQQKVADKIVGKLQDAVNGIPVDDTYITYQMDKKPRSNWAPLIGGQYQFSKRWQLRGEINCFSEDRISGLLSINYRFLGFKKSK
jgi:hypothetical protein